MCEGRPFFLSLANVAFITLPCTLHCEKEGAVHNVRAVQRWRTLTETVTMDSPPLEKSEYEILRDQNVAEVRKKAAACEAAA